MKIRMNFGIVKTVVISVVIAGVLAVIGLDIAILAGVQGISINSPAVPIVSMIAGLIVGVACVLLLVNSHYKFKDDMFCITLGFFAEKIAYEDLVMLKQNMENNELFVIVNDKSKAPVDTQIALKVNVAPTKTEMFLTEIRKHIPNVTVELYTQPKKKKKDK